jgi:hypothetical protein
LFAATKTPDIAEGEHERQRRVRAHSRLRHQQIRLWIFFRRFLHRPIQHCDLLIQHPEQSQQVFPPARGPLHTLWIVINFLIFAGTYYGIQKRAPFMWKMGWIVIVCGFLDFLILTLSAIVKLPESTHPLIASAAVLIGSATVAVYFSHWWWQQKSYFAPPTIKESD